MAYMIWITGACNLKCKYCYEGIEKINKHMSPEISKQTIQFIIDDFDPSSHNELLINFHGGEPFLQVELMEYFIHNIKKQFDNQCSLMFSATTNATLLSQQVIDFIVENNMDITVSLDGKKESHNKQRVFGDGRGSFDLALKNSLKLLNYNRDLRVRMTVNTNNVMELYDNIEFLILQGFRVIVPGIDIFDKSWNEESVEKLRLEILKIKKKYGKSNDLKISLCEPLNYCGTYCSAGMNTKHIYYTGDLYPCTVVCGYKEFSIGNVYEGTDRKKIQNLQKNISPLYESCQHCDVKNYCSAARCSLINKLATGDFHRPTEIECNLTNILYEVNGIC